MNPIILPAIINIIVPTVPRILGKTTPNHIALSCLTAMALSVMVFLHNPLPVNAYVSQNIVLIPGETTTTTTLSDDGVTVNTYVPIVGAYNKNWDEIQMKAKNITVSGKTYPIIKNSYITPAVPEFTIDGETFIKTKIPARTSGNYLSSALTAIAISFIVGGIVSLIVYRGTPNE